MAPAQSTPHKPQLVESMLKPLKAIERVMKSGRVFKRTRGIRVVAPMIGQPLTQIHLVSLLACMRYRIYYIHVKAYAFRYTISRIGPSPSPLLSKHYSSQSQAVDVDPEQLPTFRRCCIRSGWMGHKNQPSNSQRTNQQSLSYRPKPPPEPPLHHAISHGHR